MLVDRDEVERIRKRFMKLDKVGHILLQIQGGHATDRSVNRIIPAQSNEKNSSPYHRSPRIPSRHGNICTFHYIQFSS